MMKKARIFTVCALLAACCLLMSGCTGLQIGTVEELYCLPSLPSEHEELKANITALIEDGAEYAAPTSGSNIQPVQLVDLDGDGQEEALAFMRKPSEEKPLKIYIFSAENGKYRQTAVIEGSGSAIFSVIYSDLDGDGCNELVVGWKTASEMQALSVYTQRGGQPEELLRNTYVKYALTDLDSNGRNELVIFRADSEGMGLAELYVWQNGTITMRSSCKISVTMAELSNLGRVVNGTIQNQIPALFVMGVVDSDMQVTDILTAQDGELSNIVLSNITGASTQVARYVSLYPADINGDGETEVPIPVLLPGTDEEENYFRIEWRSYDSTGVPTIAETTFHDVEDGWYLILPEKWRDQVLVQRDAGSEEATVSFSYRNGGEPENFLKISAITGDSREIKAVRGGRFILSRRAETIYSAELLKPNSDGGLSMTEDELRTAFNLITAEWLAGDN